MVIAIAYSLEALSSTEKFLKAALLKTFLGFKSAQSAVID
jgi:hypothetical protein